MSTTNEPSTENPPTTQPPLRIAILSENCQLMDIACADLLGNCSTTCLTLCVKHGWAPAHLLSLSRPLEFHYPSSTLDPSFTTPDLHVKPTDTYDSCTRDLDIILVGGPPFDHRPAGADRFLKEAVPRARVAVMSTCVGGMWLASSGVLDGRKATANRGALAAAREVHKDVEWLDQRWVVDGKFWTAGGAGAGVDMLGAFIDTLFDKQIADFARESLDVKPYVRGQFYEQ